MIDQKRLIGEVAAKNGIRLEPDDPAFALVTLNEIVLQDTVAALTHEIRSSLHSFAESLAKTENRAGKVLAHDVKVAAAELRRELNSDIENASLKAHEIVNKVSAVNSSAVMVKWLATGSLAALLLFLCGVIVGRTMLGK
jgi:hypothetical protein